MKIQGFYDNSVFGRCCMGLLLSVLFHLGHKGQTATSNLLWNDELNPYESNSRLLMEWIGAFLLQRN